MLMWKVVYLGTKESTPLKWSEGDRYFCRDWTKMAWLPSLDDRYVNVTVVVSLRLQSMASLCELRPQRGILSHWGFVRHLSIFTPHSKLCDSGGRGGLRWKHSNGRDWRAEVV